MYGRFDKLSEEIKYHHEGDQLSLINQESIDKIHILKVIVKYKDYTQNLIDMVDNLKKDFSIK